MKIINTLTVSFDTPILPWELNKFRGAMSEKVGYEHEWFHNHNNETGGFHHRYPKIQYKVDTHGREMRPMLMCIGEGIKEAHHYFSQPDWGLHFGEQKRDMRIAHLNQQQYNLSVGGEFRLYRIHKWQALNSDNYGVWKKLDSIAARYHFLEQTMAAHIISFAKGVEWTIDQPFSVRITQQLKEEWITFKNLKVLCFSLEFKTNVSLPDFIGLGKGGSVGFGVLRKQ